MFCNFFFLENLAVY